MTVITKKDERTRRVLTDNIKLFLENRPEIRFAYLFGSFVDEESFRDIDLGIFIDETAAVTKDKFYDIELSTQLEDIVKCPIDIILLNRAAPAIVFNASKGMLLKNSDDDQRIDFVTLNWKMYWDFKPTLLYHMEERKHGSK